VRSWAATPSRPRSSTATCTWATWPGGRPGYRFLDWTDACVAHPFFDVATIRRGTDDAVDDDLRDRLRAAYLLAWASFEPPMSRSTAWWLRQVLAGLSLAGLS
jgi:hypothetical protein